jgi:creatinine amidohydrolase
MEKLTEGMNNLLAYMTWPQIQEAVKQGKVVIIPTGSIEQHGTALPMNVDSNSVDSIARAAAIKSGQIVTPPLVFGGSSFWRRFPGTMYLRPETFKMVIEDLVYSLLEAGFKKIFILNGHRPNMWFLDPAVVDLVDKYYEQFKFTISFSSYWDMPGVRDELNRLRKGEKGSMGHACEAETSLTMYLQPGLVRENELKKLKPRKQIWDWTADRPMPQIYRGYASPETTEGVMGDPTCASADSGVKFFNAIVDKIAQFMSDYASGQIDKYVLLK